MKEVFEETLRKLQTRASVEIANVIEDKSLQDHLYLILAELKIDSESRSRLVSEFLETGPLEPLLSDEAVSEILIHKDHIFFERQGQLHNWSDSFLSVLTYDNFVQRLSQECQVQTDLNVPFADGSWRDFRVHIASPPIAPGGFQISLRRNSKDRWSLEKLEKSGFLSREEHQFIIQALNDRKNILIVGPTGAGKTTLLNAILMELPARCRSVIIEDTDELIVPNAVSTKLLTRFDPRGQLRNYDQQDLLKQTLRMRPDRLVVGEVRGAEAKDLLMALATGHSGSFGSLHARSAREALWRLEMLIQMGAPQWNTDTIRRLIQLTIDVVIVVEKVDGQRRIGDIARIASLESVGFLLESIDHQLQPLYTFDHTVTSRYVPGGV